jgi:alpha-glucosidase
MQKIIFISLLVFASMLFSCSRVTQEIVLTSPDGKIAIMVNLDKKGAPFYSVKYGETMLLDTSFLGFTFKGMADLKSEMTIENVERDSLNETWTRQWGETKKVTNHYNRMTITFTEKQAPKRTLKIYFKAFNDGIGFRYEIPKIKGFDSIFIASEETQFNFAKDCKTWYFEADDSTHEHLFLKDDLSKVKSASTPVTFRTSENIHMSIHEANLRNYANMTLKKVKGKALTFVSDLTPWPDGVKVKTTLPMQTPWRSIQISPTAGGLIESPLIVNLNEPCVLKDTEWIKPMKYIGIWWAMHLGIETWGKSATHGATTANAKKYIDFAAQNNIQAVLIEGWNIGWEEWGGEDNFDYVTAYPDFNLKEVAEYARQKNVRIMGHLETGGNIPMFEAHIDSAFTLYEKLGINAVKTGYAGEIRPKDQLAYGQWAIAHYQRVIEKAAQHHIMINAHEPIKNTGIRRTYPNHVSQECARGTEWEAWSAGNPPSHTVTLPFTRLLEGPLDYTPGIFDILNTKNRSKMQKWHELQKNGMVCRVHTTLAKQLALMITIYSPVQMAADMIENYERHPAFQFMRDLDVDFDDTKVLNGEIGEYVTIARKAGQKWFIGSATNELPRNFEFPLTFLDDSIKYVATIYADGKDCDWEKNPTSYQINKFIVDKTSILKLNLAPGGGAAVSILPATDKEL